jgi:hypothetical protein
MLPAAARCLNHADRHAMGICVRCRRAMCAECITKVDGINFCAGCLEQLAAAAGPVPGASAVRPPNQVSSIVTVAILLLSLSVLAWAWIEAAMPGHG